MPDQWRIQDFPEVGAPTLMGGPTYDFAKFSPNCMKLKEFGRGGTRPSRSLGSAAADGSKCQFSSVQNQSVSNLVDLYKVYRSWSNISVLTKSIFLIAYPPSMRIIG